MATSLGESIPREGVKAHLSGMGGGLSGAEIGQVLQQVGIDDPFAGVTKRHRLFAALQGRQG